MQKSLRIKESLAIAIATPWRTQAPPPVRVKQVRFGKLASLQQNGAVFWGQKYVLLGRVALRFQWKVWSTFVRTVVCSRVWFCEVFLEFFTTKTRVLVMIRSPNILTLNSRKCVRFPSQSANFASKASTFGITWCDHSWPNLRIEVAEGFHIRWRMLAAQCPLPCRGFLWVLVLTATRLNTQPPCSAGFSLKR